MIRVITECNECPCQWYGTDGAEAALPTCKLTPGWVMFSRPEMPIPPRCPLRKENVLLTIGEINE